MENCHFCCNFDDIKIKCIDTHKLVLTILLRDKRRESGSNWRDDPIRGSRSFLFLLLEHGLFLEPATIANGLANEFLNRKGKLDAKTSTKED